ncbi:hypothetical protein KI387_000156, partial [Taxus chinensis]
RIIFVGYPPGNQNLDGNHEFRGIPNGQLNHFERLVRKPGWGKMDDIMTEKEREERRLKYGEACE